MSQDDLFGGGPPKPPGRSRGKRLGSEEDARRVWDAWVARQSPGVQKRCKYTAERQRLIRERIAPAPEGVDAYNADDLIAVIRWSYESDDRMPRFLRGENDRNTAYLDPESLFRECHLGARVIAAWTWIDSLEKPPEGPDSPNRPGGLQVVSGGRAHRPRREDR